MSCKINEGTLYKIKFNISQYLSSPSFESPGDGLCFESVQVYKLIKQNEVPLRKVGQYRNTLN